MIVAAGVLRTSAASLNQLCVFGDCNYTGTCTHTGRHNHRKQPAHWLRRPPQLLTSNRENAAQVKGVIAFIQPLQSTTCRKMKHDVTLGGQCVRNSLNHSNVLSRLFLSELLHLGAGSSASWQSLIQIWIMYDDEYNAPLNGALK